ncbi:MAG: S1-C subfamily serine protease [Myxococcota bacterium]|jgi:S1-C subfamily serine protease
MRVEMWWVGLSLSAGIVGGAMFSDLPVVTVVINSNDADILAGEVLPFDGLMEAKWCTQDGSCWQPVRDGLVVSKTAGTVYDGIGLQDGDVLVGYNSRSIETINNLTAMSQQLDSDRAVCLTVFRGQETIEMGLMLPGNEADEDGAITDPCTTRGRPQHRKTGCGR